MTISLFVFGTFFVFLIKTLRDIVEFMLTGRAGRPDLDSTTQPLWRRHHCCGCRVVCGRAGRGGAGNVKSYCVHPGVRGAGGRISRQPLAIKPHANTLLASPREHHLLPAKFMRGEKGRRVYQTRMPAPLPRRVALEVKPGEGPMGGGGDGSLKCSGMHPAALVRLSDPLAIITSGKGS